MHFLSILVITLAIPNYHSRPTDPTERAEGVKKKRDVGAMIL